MQKIFDTAPTSDYDAPTFNRKSGIGVPESYGRLERQSLKAAFFIAENQKIKPFKGRSESDTPFKSYQ